jgi:hypothetical protein
VKRGVTPEFVNMSKEILYPQIQGVTFVISWIQDETLKLNGKFVELINKE